MYKYGFKTQGWILFYLNCKEKKQKYKKTQTEKNLISFIEKYPTQEIVQKGLSY